MELHKYNYSNYRGIVGRHRFEKFFEFLKVVVNLLFEIWTDEVLQNIKVEVHRTTRIEIWKWKQFMVYDTPDIHCKYYIVVKGKFIMTEIGCLMIFLLILKWRMQWEIWRDGADLSRSMLHIFIFISPFHLLSFLKPALSLTANMIVTISCAVGSTYPMVLYRLSVIN